MTLIHACASAARAMVAPLLVLACLLPASGQEKSLRPGINKPFENPDVKDFQKKFEGESREVSVKRQEIVALCGLKPGMVVADVGAGTGLFTGQFARAVGPAGKVYAVDIAPRFLEHIKKTCKRQGIHNVVGVLDTPTSVKLPASSVDLVFICDTYHHFEFPFRILGSIHQALRPGGKLVLVDFRRIKGLSSEWIMSHVRAGQDIVTREVVMSGIRQVAEHKLLKENYCLVFERTAR